MGTWETADFLRRIYEALSERPSRWVLLIVSPMGGIFMGSVCRSGTEMRFGQCHAN
jgi:hypothetical protein